MSNLIGTTWKFQINPTPSQPTAPFDVEFLKDGKVNSIFTGATYTESGDDFVLTLPNTPEGEAETWTGSHTNGIGKGFRTEFGTKPAPFHMSKIS